MTTAAVLDPVLVLLPALDPVPAPEDVTPGWVAVLVVVGLIVVTVLLWFSMRKQLGKIRFDEGSDTDEASDPSSRDRRPEDGPL